MARYVLDTNILITAYRDYYGFDICPGFWDWLLYQHQQGKVVSIDKVRAEITGEDRLARWVAHSVPATMFDSTADQSVADVYADMMRWVYKGDFTNGAKAEFASKADSWVMAYAKARNDIVVTLEKHRPEAKKRVPMPNVCEAFGIEYADTFAMLRVLGAGFHWP